MCILKIVKIFYFSFVSRFEVFLSLLVFVFGYSSLDTVKVAGAFIIEVYNRCFVDIYNGMINFNDIGF